MINPVNKICDVNELEKGEIDTAIECIRKAKTISIKIKKQFNNKVIVWLSVASLNILKNNNWKNR